MCISLFTEVLFSEFNMKFVSFVMFIAVSDGLNSSLCNKTENIAFQLLQCMKTQDFQV